MRYQDGEIGMGASSSTSRPFRNEECWGFVQDHFDEHIGDLFFTKLTDWESEVEYRFLTQWEANEELFVDVSKALKAVIVGHAIAREYAPAVRALCDPYGTAARLQWMNGRPNVFKFIPRRDDD